MSVVEHLEKFRTGLFFQDSPEDIESNFRIISGLLNAKLTSLAKEDLFDVLQYHFTLALLTNNDSDAKLSLQRIVDKFSETPQRVGLLRSMYIEATEGPEKAKEFLSSRPPADIISLKRNAVLEKSKGDNKAYVSLLLKLLTVTPTDPETWAELAETYAKTGHYEKAFAAYEEVILIQPYAYNVFARLGELYHIAATAKSNFPEQISLLAEAVKHYSRAVEISPNYVRGWAGLLVTANKILAWPKLATKEAQKYEKLTAIANKQLERIVQHKLSTEENIAAARKFLGFK